MNQPFRAVLSFVALGTIILLPGVGVRSRQNQGRGHLHRDRRHGDQHRWRSC